MTTLRVMAGPRGARGERKVQDYPFKKTLGAAVRAYLSDKRAVPQDVENATGVGRRSVERLMDGDNVTLDTLGAVADFLNADLTVVFVPKVVTPKPSKPPMLRGSAPRTQEPVKTSINSARQISRRKDKR